MLSLGEIEGHSLGPESTTPRLEPRRSRVPEVSLQSPLSVRQGTRVISMSCRAVVFPASNTASENNGRPENHLSRNALRPATATSPERRSFKPLRRADRWGENVLAGSGGSGGGIRTPDTRIMIPLL